MNGRRALDRFLTTDPDDVGCAETMRLLHVYAEIVFAGGDPEREHPGITAHLRACEPCAQDLEGLLVTLRAIR